MGTTRAIGATSATARRRAVVPEQRGEAAVMEIKQRHVNRGVWWIIAVCAVVTVIGTIEILS